MRTRDTAERGAGVIDRNGVRGTIEAASASGGRRAVLVRFRAGTIVEVDSALLVSLEDGSYLLTESFDELRLRACAGDDPTA